MTVTLPTNGSESPAPTTHAAAGSVARPKGHQKAEIHAMIDKDRIVGSAKQVEGTLKEAAGKVVGDAKLVADGKNEKVEGKIQNAVGGIKDALKK